MMKIRDATAADFQDIVAIHIESWQDSYADVLPAGFLTGFIKRVLKKHWKEIEWDDRFLVNLASA